MTHYRLYTISDSDEVLGPAKILDCLNDEVAIEEAIGLLEEHAVELWEGARRVIRLEPKETRF